MNIGDKVKVIRKGLMSTDWIGTVQEVTDTSVRVKFPKRDKPLKYNIRSLARVKPAVVPKVDDRFELKEQRTLVGINDGSYNIVFKDKDGGQHARTTRIDNDMVDNVNCVINAPALTVKFDDIVYLVRNGTLVKFKRPLNNQYPFYVFNDDEVEFRLNLFARSGAKDFDLIKANNYDMRVDWLANINDIKPKFVVEQVRVLKEGMEFDKNELYQLIKAKLANENDHAAKGRNCFGVVFRKKTTGEAYQKSFHGRPCHAMMNSAGNNYPAKDYDMEFAVQYMCRILREVKHHDWLLWVMNESPWSRYCITKTIEEAMETGIRVRVDIPSNAMMCTFYALRYPTEYTKTVNAWRDYCDAGMNKAIAFFAAETNLLQHNTSGHHQLLDTYSMTLEDLIKFAKNEVGGVIEEDYNKSRRYRNVSVHHGSTKQRNNGGNTAVNRLRELDIFGGGEVKGGAFGGGGGREVSLEKAIKVTNKLLEG